MTRLHQQSKTASAKDLEDIEKKKALADIDQSYYDDLPETLRAALRQYGGSAQLTMMCLHSGHSETEIITALRRDAER